MTELVTGGGNGFHWEGRYAPDLAVALRRGLAAHGDDLPPQVKLVLVVDHPQDVLREVEVLRDLGLVDREAPLPGELAELVPYDPGKHRPRS